MVAKRKNRRPPLPPRLLLQRRRPPQQLRCFRMFSKIGHRVLKFPSDFVMLLHGHRLGPILWVLTWRKITGPVQISALECRRSKLSLETPYRNQTWECRWHHPRLMQNHIIRLLKKQLPITTMSHRYWILPIWICRNGRDPWAEELKRTRDEALAAAGLALLDKSMSTLLNRLLKDKVKTTIIYIRGNPNIQGVSSSMKECKVGWKGQIIVPMIVHVKFTISTISSVLFLR